MKCILIVYFRRSTFRRSRFRIRGSFVKRRKGRRSTSALSSLHITRNPRAPGTRRRCKVSLPTPPATSSRGRIRPCSCPCKCRSRCFHNPINNFTRCCRCFTRNTSYRYINTSRSLNTSISQFLYRPACTIHRYSCTSNSSRRCTSIP